MNTREHPAIIDLAGTDEALLPLFSPFERAVIMASKTIVESRLANNSSGG